MKTRLELKFKKPLRFLPTDTLFSPLKDDFGGTAIFSGRATIEKIFHPHREEWVQVTIKVKDPKAYVRQDPSFTAAAPTALDTAKKLYTLPCGRYSTAWLIEFLLGKSSPSHAERSRIGCRLRSLVGIVKDGKCLHMIGSNRWREYELKPAVDMTAFNHVMDTYAMITVGRRRIDVLHGYYFPTLDPDLRRRDEIRFPSWGDLSREYVSNFPASAPVMDPAERRDIAQRERELFATIMVERPIEEHPKFPDLLERYGAPVGYSLRRRRVETLAGYSARVQPMLEKDEIGRPTSAGHERFCLEKGWDGQEPPPISRLLYDTVANWKAPEPPPPEPVVGALPCPFCGSKHRVMIRPRGAECFEGFCDSCLSTGPLAISEQGAWRDWNKRSQEAGAK